MEENAGAEEKMCYESSIESEAKSFIQKYSRSTKEDKKKFLNDRRLYWMKRLNELKLKSERPFMVATERPPPRPYVYTTFNLTDSYIKPKDDHEWSNLTLVTDHGLSSATTAFTLDNLTTPLQGPPSELSTSSTSSVQMSSSESSPQPPSVKEEEFTLAEIHTLENLLASNSKRLKTTKEIQFLISMPPFIRYNRTVSSVSTKIMEMKNQQ